MEKVCIPSLLLALLVVRIVPIQGSHCHHILLNFMGHLSYLKPYTALQAKGTTPGSRAGPAAVQIHRGQHAVFCINCGVSIDISLMHGVELMLTLSRPPITIFSS